MHTAAQTWLHKLCITTEMVTWGFTGFKIQHILLHGEKRIYPKTQRLANLTVKERIMYGKCQVLEKIVYILSKFLGPDD